jgi:hypothetical protein
VDIHGRPRGRGTRCLCRGREFLRRRISIGAIDDYSDDGINIFYTEAKYPLISSGRQRQAPCRTHRSGCVMHVTQGTCGERASAGLRSRSRVPRTATGTRCNARCLRAGVSVVVENIGQETITYVSNVYKYYIGHRLILESQAATKEAVDKMKGIPK